MSLQKTANLGLSGGFRVKLLLSPTACYKLIKMSLCVEGMAENPAIPTDTSPDAIRWPWVTKNEKTSASSRRFGY